MTSTPKARRGSSIFVRLFAVGALLVACGGGGSNSASADDWAADVCAALSSYLEGLQQEGTNLQTEADPNDLAATKADLVGFMNTAVTNTEEMISQVEAAGEPDLKDGAAMSSAFQDGLQEVRQAFVDAQGLAEALPVDQPVAFAQATTALSQSLQQAATKAQETLAEIGERYPEASEALNEQADCQEIQP